MGGVDITTEVYSNGVITIESVTGDIVITATYGNPCAKYRVGIHAQGDLDLDFIIVVQI